MNNDEYGGSVVRVGGRKKKENIESIIAFAVLSNINVSKTALNKFPSLFAFSYV